MDLPVIDNVQGIRGLVAALRRQQRRVALVPTMGALHEGHLQLVRTARRFCDAVVVSIFVNPLQFGPQEDLARYPRDLASDVQKLSPLEVAAVFHPTVAQMYPDGDSRTRVRVQEMSGRLCGRTRPGHFEGVATVVTKLFNIVSPDVAVFGEKDAQQLAIIRRMVKDLNMPIDIVAVPTVRESDGLAMSSRNRYLSPEDRERAPALYHALMHARERAQKAPLAAEDLVEAISAELTQAGITPEYIEVVDPDDLTPVARVVPGAKVLIALAAWLGRARLIDNIRLDRD